MNYFSYSSNKMTQEETGWFYEQDDFWAFIKTIAAITIISLVIIIIGMWKYNYFSSRGNGL